MTGSLKIVSCAVLFFLASCKDHNLKMHEADHAITVLMRSADNNKLSANYRLSAALKADSMAMVTKNDIARLRCVKYIATLYFQVDSIELAKSYFLKTEQIARANSNRDTLAIALNNLGVIYNETSQYDSALAYYEAVRQVYEEDNDSVQLAQILVNIGIVYKNQGRLEIAFDVSLKAARILDVIKAKDDLASAYTTLGNILKDMNRFDDALSYHLKALQLRKDENDSSGVAGSLNNVANIYRRKGEYNRALDYYLSSLEIKRALGSAKALATAIDNIAETYVELKEYSKAEKYFIEILDLQGVANDLDRILTTSNRLANLYLREEECFKAQHIALRTLRASPSTGFLRQRLDNNLILAKVYRCLGRYDSALQFSLNANDLKDSLFNSNVAEAVSKMNVRYKTEENVKELRYSQMLGVAKSDQIRTQGRFIAMLTALLLLFFLLVVLLYRSNKFRKQANQRAETLLAELNHRVKNILQTITSMLQLQIHQTEDETQIAAIQATKNRVDSIYGIHELLYWQKYDGDIDVKNFVEALVARLSHVFEEAHAKFATRVSIVSIQLPIDTAISIGLILNELVTNIYKYAKLPKEKPILEIELGVKDQVCRILVSDNCGYWNLQEAQMKSKGLGLILVDTLAQQIEAAWNVTVTEKGTIHEFDFEITI